MKHVVGCTAALLGMLILGACTGGTTGQNGTASSGANGPSMSDDLPAGTFASSAEGGFSGDAYVRGYAYTETVDEPFCMEDCEQFDYVFFEILETNNAALDDFLTINEGNAYVQDNAIGLGCDEDGIISYVNQSAQYQMREFTLSQEASSAILTSSRGNPVTLHLTKLPLGGGTEAPACYGHFTQVEIRN